MYQNVRNVARKYGAIVGGVGFAASQSFATGVDLSALTGAVDLTTVTAAILAIAALKFAPQIAKYAVGAISRMFPK